MSGDTEQTSKLTLASPNTIYMCLMLSSWNTSGLLMTKRIFLACEL